MGNRLIAGETTHFAIGTKETGFPTRIRSDDDDILTRLNSEVEVFDENIAIRPHQFDVVKANDSILRSNVSRVISLIHGAVMAIHPNTMSLVHVAQHSSQIRHTSRVTKDSSASLSECSIDLFTPLVSSIHDRPTPK